MSKQTIAHVGYTTYEEDKPREVGGKAAEEDAFFLGLIHNF
jgi:hypothetical protein